MGKKDAQGIQLFFDDTGECTADYEEFNHNNCWGIECCFLEIRNFEIPKSDETDQCYFCTAADKPVVKVLKDEGMCPRDFWWSKIEGAVLYVIRGTKDDTTERKKSDKENPESTQ